MRTRIAIEQAKGMLAEAHDIQIDAAFELSRSYARRNNLRIGDVARCIGTAS